MRAFIDPAGHGFSVCVSERDIADFTPTFPCSGVIGLRGVRFTYDASGNLVDIQCANRDPSGLDWDGPGLLALSQDAQKYAENRPAFARAGYSKRYS
jgi:hypothetical protein